MIKICVSYELLKEMAYLIIATEELFSGSNISNETGGLTSFIEVSLLDDHT